MSGRSESGKKTRPVACDLTSINNSQRERHRSLVGWLSENVREARELPGGYEFRFVYEPSTFLTLSEFVTLERLCCPFTDFRLEVRSGEKSIWFRMTGEGEAKQVLRDELIPSD